MRNPSRWPLKQLMVNRCTANTPVSLGGTSLEKISFVLLKVAVKCKKPSQHFRWSVYKGCRDWARKLWRRRTNPQQTAYVRTDQSLEAEVSDLKTVPWIPNCVSDRLLVGIKNGTEFIRRILRMAFYECSIEDYPSLQIEGALWLMDRSGPFSSCQRWCCTYLITGDISFCLPIQGADEGSDFARPPAGRVLGRTSCYTEHHMTICFHAFTVLLHAWGRQI